MTPTPLAQQIADWSHSFDLSDAPAEVVGVARRAILDTVGVMVAGGAHGSVQRIAVGWPDPGGPCSTVGRMPASAEMAALINGMAAHVWDFDDTSYAGIMHGSAVVLPVVLALAQETGTSEASMVASFIAGSEVSYALGDLCGHQHYFSGWWSTATIGVIGATAAAARLLALDPSQTAHAIGMAAVTSGGGKSLFGTDGKPLLVGETARRAIAFARAAGLGLTGPVDAFEGRNGFFALLTDMYPDHDNGEMPGQHWRLVDPGLFIKTNPLCSAAQAAIEQTAALVNTIDGDLNDIVAIEAGVPELVAISLMHDRPSTPQQAQFSLPYALACTALHGRVRLADLTPEALRDPAKVRLMGKVTKTVDDNLSTDADLAKHPEWARITISLHDGSRHSGICAEAYGLPGRPLSDADLVAKFRLCLDFAGVDRPSGDPLAADLLQLATNLLAAPYQPRVPAAPLNGPITRDVIQPP